MPEGLDLLLGYSNNKGRWLDGNSSKPKKSSQHISVSVECSADNCPAKWEKSENTLKFKASFASSGGPEADMPVSDNLR